MFKGRGVCPAILDSPFLRKQKFLRAWWRRVLGLASAGGGEVLYSPEFYDGFETGDTRKWDAVILNGQSEKIVTDPVHHGTYAYTIDAFGFVRHAVPRGTKHYFVRLYVRFADLTGTGNVELLEMWSDAPSEPLFILYYGTVDSDWILRIHDFDGAWVNGSTPLTEDWHCIVVELEAGNNPLKVWLDGNLEIDRTISREDGVGENILTLLVWLDYTPAWPPYHYVDCIIGDFVKPSCDYYPHLGV